MNVEVASVDEHTDPGARIGHPMQNWVFPGAVG